MVQLNYFHLIIEKSSLSPLTDNTNAIIDQVFLMRTLLLCIGYFVELDSNVWSWYFFCENIIPLYVKNISFLFLLEPK